MYLLCTYVGPIHLADFSRTRWSPQPEAGLATTIELAAGAGVALAKEVDRVLRRVEQKLTALNHAVPMAEIKDLPPAMQNHVVGVPRTWVQLFWHLEEVIFHYSRANRPRP
jgi:hypothetical protein